LPCMPCTLEGCERNIRSRSACLDELTPERLLAAISHALA
jgi:lipopolysaccharide heptosyltransferase III